MHNMALNEEIMLFQFRNTSGVTLKDEVSLG